MKFLRAGNIEWSKEPGYRRGVIYPYGGDRHPDVQVQEVVVEPGNDVKPHFHSHQTEFIYVLQGRLTLSFDKRTIVTGPGDLVVVEPGDRHAARNIGREAVRLLVVKLNGSPDDSTWLP